MPPLRGAKINSGFLLVRRRFGLLLFRGAQLIATVHTYFCSRPRKMATATFAHPSTNPPRFFHYACRHCALCHSRTTLLFDQRVHLTVHLLLFFLLLILSLSLPVFPLPPVSLLLRGKLAAIAVARFSRNRDYQPQQPRDLFLLPRHRRDASFRIITATLLYVY